MTPILVVVMGVSGCGKSTLGRALAQDLDMNFMEADDFHSQESKTHMAAGKPLTDAMREPWIQAMCEHLKSNENHFVLAYSGLRKSHRQTFRAQNRRTVFLHLEGPRQEVARRCQNRSGHFMPAALLNSQFDALEPTSQEVDIFSLDLTQSLDQLLADAILIIRRELL